MGISFLEANLITPTIVGRRMTLNPLAIILVVSFWIWLWGPVGGVIALPLLIMFKVICDHTPALRVVGALIGAPLTRVAKMENETIPIAPPPAIIEDSAPSVENDPPPPAPEPQLPLRPITGIA